MSGIPSPSSSVRMSLSSVSFSSSSRLFLKNMLLLLPTIYICIVYIVSSLNIGCMLYSHLYHPTPEEQQQIPPPRKDDDEEEVEINDNNNSKFMFTSRTIEKPPLGDTYCSIASSQDFALIGFAYPILITTALAYLFGNTIILMLSLKEKKEKKKKKDDDHYHYQHPPPPATTTTTTTTRWFHLRRLWKIMITNSHSGGGDWDYVYWSKLLVMIPSCYILYIAIITKPPSALNLSSSTTIEVIAMIMVFSGDVAVFALSFFLIPVSRHSILLDIFLQQVDMTHALIFHRIAGWISFIFTLIHGILFLLFFGLEGLNNNVGFFTNIWNLVIPRMVCWWSPSSILSPPPFAAGKGEEVDDTGTTEQQQCTLQWVNFTGLISMIAFVLLAITSIPFVRRKFYKLFYNVHVITGWMMMIFAILHVPSVGRFMLPGLIYYIATTVPIWVQHYFDRCGSPLIQISKIVNSGNCFVLEFQGPQQQQQQRNDNKEDGDDDHIHLHAFAKLCVPELSYQWHPFSVILVKNNKVRILFRATGPFTKELSNRLFPSTYYSGNSKSKSVNNRSSEIKAVSPPPPPPPPPRVLLDAFYSEGCNWLDGITKHDTILMVAGGVGIVPFLSFIPSMVKEQLSLQSKRKKMTASHNNSSYNVNETTSLVPIKEQQPTKEQPVVELHWYCREIGLARYVQNEYFEKWKEDIAAEWKDWTQNALEMGTQPRGQEGSLPHGMPFPLFKIVIHITSQAPNRKDSDSSSSDTESNSAEATSNLSPFSSLDSFSDENSDETTVTAITRTFPENKTRTLEEAHWKVKPENSSISSFAVCGMICIIGLMIHVWQYPIVMFQQKEYTFVRMHGFMMIMVAAFVISIFAEIWKRRNELSATATTADKTSNVVDESCGLGSSLSLETATSCSNMPSPFQLEVQGGRPSVDSVIKCIRNAPREKIPGLYLCGPVQLRSAIISAVKKERVYSTKPCAIYENLSEM